MTLTPSFKPKACQHCGTSFIPLRSMQRVCSPICATKKVKADKAKEKASLRERKAALKRIPDLLREAQTAFNAYIRKRDEAQPCICCGRSTVGPEASGVRSHSVDAGHYRSVGSAAHLRFNEDNCHAQLVLCNRWGAGRAVDYRIGLVARIGAARVEALESDNKVRKWTADELRAIRKEYTERRKALEKERA